MAYHIAANMRYTTARNTPTSNTYAEMRRLRENAHDLMSEKEWNKYITFLFTQVDEKYFDFKFHSNRRIIGLSNADLPNYRFFPDNDPTNNHALERVSARSEVERTHATTFFNKMMKAIRQYERNQPPENRGRALAAHAWFSTRSNEIAQNLADRLLSRTPTPELAGRIAEITRAIYACNDFYIALQETEPHEQHKLFDFPYIKDTLLKPYAEKDNTFKRHFINSLKRMNEIVDTDRENENADYIENNLDLPVRDGLNDEEEKNVKEQALALAETIHHENSENEEAENDDDSVTGD